MTSSSNRIARADGLLIPLMALSLISACAIPVKVDYDARLGVSRCHRFAWQDAGTTPAAAAFDNPINLQRLREAVSRQLLAHGMSVATDLGHADCLIGAAIGARDAVVPGPRGFAWGAGWGWGGRGAFGVGAQSGYLDREGSVSVDLYDASSHEPIWHASAQRDVTSLTGSDAQNQINEAVKALFDKFPARGA